MKKGQKRGRGGGKGGGRGRGGGGKAGSSGGSKRRKGEEGPVAIAPEQESAKPAAMEEDADPFAEMGASGKDDGFSAADDSDVLYRSDFYPSEDGLMPVGGAGVEQWLDAPMPDADMVCGAADEVTMFAVQDELMGMPQSAAEIGDL